MDIASKQIEIDGLKIHFKEIGEGRPIVFLYGLPQSSQFWDAIIADLSLLGNCIVPDLKKMGESITDRVRYLEKFIDKLKLKHVILVMQDSGSVIGLDYAMKHEDNCAGLVCYESFVRSVKQNELSLLYLEARTQPNSHFNELPDGIAMTPADQLINSYSEKMVKSTLPKLFLYSMPGFITTMMDVAWVKNNWPQVELMDLEEEDPKMISAAISAWLQGMEQSYE